MPPLAPEFHLLIAGGGIVGLAVALSVTEKFPRVSVTVLEKEPAVGRHQTGHNSGVIHSGLYYAPGSLKARLAVAGGEMMSQFCREHAVPYEICGKVVVATDEAELPRLAALHERGRANGLAGLELIGPERLRELEPHAAGIQALYVPTTGIVDFPAAAQRMAALVIERGGRIETSTTLLQGRREGRQWVLETSSGTIRADGVITTAGLHEDRVARALGAPIETRIVPFRGEYYELKPGRAHLVRGLIYPVPDPAFPFLGVHYTRMIHGGVEAGPNAVLALKREGYARTDFDLADVAEMLAFPGFWTFASRHWRAGFDEMRRSWSKHRFTQSLQRLVPDVREDDLIPAGAGVRAQAMGPNGELIADFQIERQEGALHILNAPSPAATASLAIGQYVAGIASTSLGYAG